MDKEIDDAERILEEKLTKQDVMDWLQEEDPESFEELSTAQKLDTEEEFGTIIGKNVRRFPLS